MDSILVTGNGALHGAIPIAGAKNACLTLMPATLLSEEPLTLTNAPRLSDIATMSALLRSFGAEVSSMNEGLVVALSSHNIGNLTADYDLSLIHISEPTRLRRISYAVFCLKKNTDTSLRQRTQIPMSSTPDL